MTVYSRKTIETLLRRFMDGQTDIGEEQLLTDYFRTARDIPEEWDAYREMFAYFDRGLKDDALLQPTGSVDGTHTAIHRRYWVAAAVLLFAVGITAILLRPAPSVAPVVADVTVRPSVRINADKHGTHKTSSVRKDKRLLNIPFSPKIQPVAARPSLPKPRHTTGRLPTSTLPPHGQYELIEQQYREIAVTIAQAQAETIVATIQSQGLQVVYNEDGSISCTEPNTELTNIIAL